MVYTWENTNKHLIICHTITMCAFCFVLNKLQSHCVFMQSLKDELQDCENKVAEIESKLQTVTEKYASSETAALAKDLTVLRKKLHAAEQKSAEVRFLLFFTFDLF